MDERRYTLKGDYPMKVGGRHVQPGEQVAMTEAAAERYVAAGRLELVADDAPPVNADGLRTDGPTIEEYVLAGYKPEHYPPQGYAEKPSKGLDVYRAEVTAKNRPSTEGQGGAGSQAGADSASASAAAGAGDAGETNHADASPPPPAKGSGKAKGK